ncbi:MAG TPA: hypothetical protein VFU21_26420 [Kofleriaceae bacterium]|nr:hypothetical protein [Kofleriaceae bacterium]
MGFRLSTTSALAAVLALAAGCAKEIQDPRSDQVDFTDPKSVTAQIFHAAATGRTQNLRALCDPRGENDEDTARICALTPADPDWPAFRAEFARARLNGEPRVSGDRAALHFVFGPDATRSETMELVQRDGRWYLSAF